MRTITLPEAYQILESAAAIIVENQVLFPNLSKITGQNDNEFLYLEWENEGLWYELKFDEEGNQTPTIVGTSLFLYDTDAQSESDHTQITILQERNLE